MLIHKLIQMQCHEAAQAVALNFVLYIRPSETLGLTSACLAPPSRVGATTSDKWCVTLHPAEADVAPALLNMLSFADKARQ